MLLALWGIGPSAGYAQLISPGRLTSAHAELEGIRNCGNCHTLRQRGIADTKCLECHVPLDTRIQQDVGLHASLEFETCADCHKEHAGRELDMVRFDTTGFDHATAGFDLLGAHQSETCRSCHNPELITDSPTVEFKRTAGALGKTFLGLPNDCASCHNPVNPHGDNFANRSCRECHAEDAWTPAPGFDHNDTDYRLTGAHRSASCTNCHVTNRDGTTVYAPVASTRCTDCHVDPHANQMGQACEDCHDTGDWSNLDGPAFERRFNHASTAFPLEGLHTQLACRDCHNRSSSSNTVNLVFDRDDRGNRYPTPRAETCESCHVDSHDGELVELSNDSGCESCHSLSGWLPAAFDVARHNQQTDFELSGAHLPLPCTTCHLDQSQPPHLRFALGQQTCISCHVEDDPHGDQFSGRSCQACHSVDTFGGVEFDHSTTRYPLDGAHQTVTCQACHVEETLPGGQLVRRYRPLATECRSCHAS